MRRIGLITGMLLMLAVAANAQATAPTTTAATSPPRFTKAQQDILGSLMLAKLGLAICGMDPDGADCKKADYNKMYGDAMSKVVADPALVSDLVSEAVLKYESMKDLSKSAAQVSQIADQQNAEIMRVIVAQNQRVIELLEQILKKRP